MKQLRSWLRRALDLFRAPTRVQYGALCWRRGERGVEILLVTTRRTGRWTPPKGNPMRGKTGSMTAAREAWEEAGVRGQVAPVSLGTYRIRKVMPDGMPTPMNVRLFALMITEIAETFPETGQRKRRWFKQAEAAKLVHEPDLCRLIEGFRPEI